MVPKIVRDLNEKIRTTYWGSNPAVKWVHESELYYRVLQGFEERKDAESQVVKLERVYETRRRLHGALRNKWILCEVMNPGTWDEWCKRHTTSTGLELEYPQGREYYREIRTFNGIVLSAHGELPTESETERFTDALKEAKSKNLAHYFFEQDRRQEKADREHRERYCGNLVDKYAPKLFIGPAVQGASLD